MPLIYNSTSMSSTPLQIASSIRIDSFVNNSLSNARFRFWGLCDIVKKLFSLGASSTMQNCHIIDVIFVMTPCATTLQL